MRGRRARAHLRAALVVDDLRLTHAPVALHTQVQHVFTDAPVHHHEALEQQSFTQQVMQKSA